VNYYLDEVVFCLDLEWNFSEKQLVGKNAHTPYIDFIVVIFPLEELWRDV
jgi:hypothetical protein